MPPDQHATTGPDASPESIEVFERLADEIRVLRDVLDEIRKHLSFAVRNPDRSPCSVLRQMALDPTADNWGEKLVIVRSATAVSDSAVESEELSQARDTIRELLGVCKLNLDELESDTQAVIDRARRVLSLPADMSLTLSEQSAKTPPCDSTPASSGRLF